MLASVLVLTRKKLRSVDKCEQENGNASNNVCNSVTRWALLSLLMTHRITILHVASNDDHERPQPSSENFRGLDKLQASEPCESREASVKKGNTSKNCKFTDEELSTHCTD